MRKRKIVNKGKEQLFQQTFVNGEVISDGIKYIQHEPYWKQGLKKETTEII